MISHDPLVWVPVVELVELVEGEPLVEPCCALSLAAAATQSLNGVPFWPATCFLLSLSQAARAVVFELLARWAMSLTQLEKGVPCWPATCFLVSLWQYLP